jgi:hypothetical protein
VNSKEPHIKSLVDKHRGDGKQSTELFNSVVSELLESDKKLPLKTYEHVTGLLSNAVRNYIPKYGRLSTSTFVPFFALMLSNLRKFAIFDIISNICLS